MSKQPDGRPSATPSGIIFQQLQPPVNTARQYSPGQLSHRNIYAPGSVYAPGAPIVNSSSSPSRAVPTIVRSPPILTSQSTSSPNATPNSARSTDQATKIPRPVQSALLNERQPINDIHTFAFHPPAAVLTQHPSPNQRPVISGYPISRIPHSAVPSSMSLVYPSIPATTTSVSAPLIYRPIMGSQTTTSGIVGSAPNSSGGVNSNLQFVNNSIHPSTNPMPQLTTQQQQRFGLNGSSVAAGGSNSVANASNYYVGGGVVSSALIPQHPSLNGHINFSHHQFIGGNIASSAPTSVLLNQKQPHQIIGNGIHLPPPPAISTLNNNGIANPNNPGPSDLSHAPPPPQTVAGLDLRSERSVTSNVDAGVGVTPVALASHGSSPLTPHPTITQIHHHTFQALLTGPGSLDPACSSAAASPSAAVVLASPPTVVAGSGVPAKGASRETPTANSQCTGGELGSHSGDVHALSDITSKDQNNPSALQNKDLPAVGASLVDVDGGGVRTTDNQIQHHAGSNSLQKDDHGPSHTFGEAQFGGDAATDGFSSFSDRGLAADSNFATGSGGRKETNGGNVIIDSSMYSPNQHGHNDTKPHSLGETINAKGSYHISGVSPEASANQNFAIGADTLNENYHHHGGLPNNVVDANGHVATTAGDSNSNIASKSIPVKSAHIQNSNENSMIATHGIVLTSTSGSPSTHPTVPGEISNNNNIVHHQQQVAKNSSAQTGSVDRVLDDVIHYLDSSVSAHHPHHAGNDSISHNNQAFPGATATSPGAPAHHSDAGNNNRLALNNQLLPVSAATGEDKKHLQSHAQGMHVNDDSNSADASFNIYDTSIVKPKKNSTQDLIMPSTLNYPYENNNNQQNIGNNVTQQINQNDLNPVGPRVQPNSSQELPSTSHPSINNNMVSNSAFDGNKNIIVNLPVSQTDSQIPGIGINNQPLNNNQLFMLQQQQIQQQQLHASNNTQHNHPSIGIEASSNVQNNFGTTQINEQFGTTAIRDFSDGGGVGIHSFEADLLAAAAAVEAEAGGKPQNLMNGSQQQQSLHPSSIPQTVNASSSANLSPNDAQKLNLQQSGNAIPSNSQSNAGAAAPPQLAIGSSSMFPNFSAGQVIQSSQSESREAPAAAAAAAPALTSVDSNANAQNFSPLVLQQQQQNIQQATALAAAAFGAVQSANGTAGRALDRAEGIESAVRAVHSFFTGKFENLRKATTIINDVIVQIQDQVAVQSAKQKQVEEGLLMEIEKRIKNGNDLSQQIQSLEHKLEDRVVCVEKSIIEETGSLKEEISGLRNEVTSLKTLVSSVQEEIKLISKKLSSQHSELTEKLDEEVNNVNIKHDQLSKDFEEFSEDQHSLQKSFAQNLKTFHELLKDVDAKSIQSEKSLRLEVNRCEKELKNSFDKLKEQVTHDLINIKLETVDTSSIAHATQTSVERGILELRALIEDSEELLRTLLNKTDSRVISLEDFRKSSQRIIDSLSAQLLGLHSMVQKQQQQHGRSSSVNPGSNGEASKVGVVGTSPNGEAVAEYNPVVDFNAQSGATNTGIPAGQEFNGSSYDVGGGGGALTNEVSASSRLLSLKHDTEISKLATSYHGVHNSLKGVNNHGMVMVVDDVIDNNNNSANVNNVYRNGKFRGAPSTSPSGRNYYGGSNNNVGNNSQFGNNSYYNHQNQFSGDFSNNGMNQNNPSSFAHGRDISAGVHKAGAFLNSAINSNNNNPVGDLGMRGRANSGGSSYNNNNNPSPNANNSQISLKTKDDNFYLLNSKSNNNYRDGNIDHADVDFNSHSNIDNNNNGFSSPSANGNASQNHDSSSQWREMLKLAIHPLTPNVSSSAANNPNTHTNNSGNQNLNLSNYQQHNNNNNSVNTAIIPHASSGTNNNSTNISPSGGLNLMPTNANKSTSAFSSGGVARPPAVSASLDVRTSIVASDNLGGGNKDSRESVAHGGIHGSSVRSAYGQL